MNHLYELRMFRNGDTIGTVLFSTEPDGHPIPAFAYEWCRTFLLGVDHDQAELARVEPSQITPEGMTRPTRALLLATWPPEL